MIDTRLIEKFRMCVIFHSKKDSFIHLLQKSKKTVTKIGCWWLNFFFSFCLAFFGLILYSWNQNIKSFNNVNNLCVFFFRWKKNLSIWLNDDDQIMMLAMPLKHFCCCCCSYLPSNENVDQITDDHYEIFVINEYDHHHHW